MAEQVEPAVRFELTAGGLRNRCSTPELRWLTIVNGKVLTLTPTLPPLIICEDVFEVKKRQRVELNRSLLYSL